MPHSENPFHSVPHANTMHRRSLQQFSRNLSGNSLGKLFLKCSHQMSDFTAKMHQNSILTGALPQAPVADITAFP